MHALRTLTAGPAVVMLGLAAALLPAPAAAASGDPTDDVVRDLSISIDLDEDGVMHVKETYDWDFGEREGLGFFRTLSTQMPSDEGPRVVDYEDFALTSPTGAPAAVADIEESRDALQLSLGAPEGSEDTRTGLQTYELSYTVHGAVNPSSWDWIVAGPDQDVSIERVTTEVTAPEEILDGACWQGTDSDLDDGRPCPAEIDGETMTATATTLEPGGWQGVEVTVPEGTFSAATPVYAEPTASERLADTIAPVSDRIGTRCCRPGGPRRPRGSPPSPESSCCGAAPAAMSTSPSSLPERSRSQGPLWGSRAWSRSPRPSPVMRCRTT
ncbi:DUF2207 domain-containing protein [Nesterenkonia sp. PF2B19]|uniref:DUF2207 domain-containing protein n=1 Tax=Nesterenkonia sp. PF2B19 TaxID=1881858 RepID=UPI0008724E4E